ncbi:MAG TPA: glycoside hydrolase family 172 protein [Chthonomonadaceae bacterium]|nr:glycoside hydrolase family 172 protein [Chthonomonadaceae bacterium]
MHNTFANFLLLFILLSLPAQRGTITLASLLREMTDRDAVARWPSPEYAERQASSYDRRSKTPADPEGWFANDDFSQFIRSEENAGRREWVMMEADGPGCVVRIWFGGMKPMGILRFYLDGAPIPAIEGPAYDILIGTLLTERPLAIENAHGIPGAPGGMNLFLPIPYSRHCKITYEEPGRQDSNTPPEGRWYNIEYRTYAPGTRVRTFTLQDLQAARPEIEKTCQTLLHSPELPAGKESALERTLAPGSEMGMELTKGPHAIRWLQAQILTDRAEDLEQALRSIVLSLRFDGEETVWCPLGDFFGSGVGLNVLESWDRTITPDGRMICRWVMPYATSASLTLQNLGQQPVTVHLRARVSGWRWDDRSMHFHANWRQQYPLPTRPHSDWNYIEATGKGVYMGDALAVFNPAPDWWGEGDEKIWVDGEAFPSHFGTGSEDYYGYSWGNTTLFQGPFSNQIRCDGPGNSGHTVVTRVRCLDAIPFTRSLRFDMEVWHWADTNVAYAATTYWYALPGATSNRGPSPEEAERPIPQMPGHHPVSSATAGQE